LHYSSGVLRRRQDRLSRSSLPIYRGRKKEEKKEKEKERREKKG